MQLVFQRLDAHLGGFGIALGAFDAQTQG